MADEYQPSNPLGVGAASFLNSFSDSLQNRWNQQNKGEQRLSDEELKEKFDQWHQNQMKNREEDVNAKKPVSAKGGASADPNVQLQKNIIAAMNRYQHFIQSGINNEQFRFSDPQTQAQMKSQLSKQYFDDPNNQADIPFIVHGREMEQIALSKNPSLRSVYSSAGKYIGSTPEPGIPGQGTAIPQANAAPVTPQGQGTNTISPMSPITAPPMGGQPNPGDQNQPENLNITQ